MHPDLKVPRRVVLQRFHTYLQADAEWRRAQEDAAAWLPDFPRRGVVLIGAPRSRLRRLYEEREHAIEAMAVARLKLERAKARAQDRSDRARNDARVVLYITADPHRA